MRLVAVVVLGAGAVACGSSGHGSVADAGLTPDGEDGALADGYGYDVAPDRVSATCPMSFSQGIPGQNPCYDAGPSCTPMAPPYTCEPLPSQCATNPTCDCIACNGPCSSCTSQGNGYYSDGGGGGAKCSYDPSSGTFTLTCINA